MTTEILELWKKATQAIDNLYKAAEFAKTSPVLRAEYRIGTEARELVEELDDDTTVTVIGSIGDLLNRLESELLQSKPKQPSVRVYFAVVKGDSVVPAGEVEFTQRPAWEAPFFQLDTLESRVCAEVGASD